MSSWLLPVALTMLLPWLAGCESVQDATLTGHMWEATGREYREPAGTANLRLYHTTDQKDVLVRYDEELKSNGHVRPRAFLLFENQRKLKAGLRPSFLSADKAARIESFPVAVVPEFDKDALAREELQACIWPDGHQFALVSKGRTIGSFSLPVYGVMTPRNLAARALFLPAVVAGDATIYAGAIGCVAGLEYLGSLAQDSTASHSSRLRGK